MLVDGTRISALSGFPGYLISSLRRAIVAISNTLLSPVRSLIFVSAVISDPGIARVSLSGSPASIKSLHGVGMPTLRIFAAFASIWLDRLVHIVPDARTRDFGRCEARDTPVEHSAIGAER